MDDKKLSDEDIHRIVKIAIQEFMTNIYGGIGKNIFNKLIWAALGAVIYFLYGHVK